MMAESGGTVGSRSVRVVPGLRAEFNHDIDVGNEFLEHFEPIGNALNDTRLLGAFSAYDRIAKSNKRTFHLLGVLSLAFALITLLSVGIGIVFGISVTHSYGLIGLCAESGSIIAIGLILWNRLGRYRVRWCGALFCRERLRQWHFQVFLDGQLMSLLSSQPEEFRKEIDRRWAVLEQGLRDGFGMMSSFVHHGSRDEDFFHQPSKYTDLKIAGLVIGAMSVLRFGHEHRFGQRKVEPVGETIGLTLQERASFSSALASGALAGAVIVAALGFLNSLAIMYPALKLLSVETLTLGRILGGSALILAVISAATRAYRTGYTMPDEADSYAEFCNRAQECKAVLESSASEVEKFRQLERLEEECVLELRRFLKMKMHATFIL
jgi:hypothetical protein